jgi:hypothetical protein
MGWYLNVEHGGYPGHEQCSLAWVFMNELVDSRLEPPKKWNNKFWEELIA